MKEELPHYICSKCGIRVKGIWMDRLYAPLCEEHAFEAFCELPNAKRILAERDELRARLTKAEDENAVLRSEVEKRRVRAEQQGEVVRRIQEDSAALRKALEEAERQRDWAEGKAQGVEAALRAQLAEVREALDAARPYLLTRFPGRFDAALSPSPASGEGVGEAKEVVRDRFVRDVAFPRLPVDPFCARCGKYESKHYGPEKFCFSEPSGVAEETKR